MNSRSHDGESFGSDSLGHWQSRIDEFESALFAGQTPRIEDVPAGEDEKSPALLEELVHREIEYRGKRGDSFALAEYLNRFPALNHDSECVSRLQETYKKFVLQRPSRAGSLYDPTVLRAADTDCRDAPTGRAKESRGAAPVQASTASKLKPGTVLGNYTILESIGRGGMGQVYKASHQTMQRVVALKVLSPKIGLSQEGLMRFRREVKLVANLSHPNIVTAHDADEAGGVPFLVMEFVEGTDLSRLVRERGRLPLNLAIKYIIDAARGLEHAHSKGVIHRDVKPGNLIVNSLDVVKVLDLGLARWKMIPGSSLDAELQLTQTGQMVGTADFISPEQSIDSKYADERSDVYSLGCTLWYLLTGSHVYGGNSMMERVLAHREQQIPSVSEVLFPINAQPHSTSSANQDRDRARDQPAERASQLGRIDALFRRMVAKRPEDRFQSMADVIAALQSDSAGIETIPMLRVDLLAEEFKSAPEGTDRPTSDSHVTEMFAGTAQLKILKPTGDAETVALDPSQCCLIGRGSLSTLRIEDQYTSRTHCQIEAVGHDWVLKDVGSSSGTFVGGQRIEKHILKPGEVIRIGKTTLTFELHSAQALPTFVTHKQTPSPYPDGGTRFDASELIGRHVHRYVLERLLVESESGALYLAQHIKGDVAVKVIWPEPGTDDRRRRRFIRSVLSLRELRHPNLVRLHSAGRFGPYCWMAMEYIVGENMPQLIDRIGTDGMLDWQIAFRVALDIGRALTVLETAGVVHRNITPESILLSTDGCIKLAGVSLARAKSAEQAEEITSRGELVGHLGYLAPEMLLSDSFDHRADLYGLGATAYGLLTGRPPYIETKVSQLLKAQLAAEPPRPKLAQRAIPDLFEAAVRRLIACQPSDRYQSAEALVRDLEQIGKSTGIATE